MVVIVPELVGAHDVYELSKTIGGGIVGGGWRKARGLAATRRRRVPADDALQETTVMHVPQ